MRANLYGLSAVWLSLSVMILTGCNLQEALRLSQLRREPVAEPAEELEPSLPEDAPVDAPEEIDVHFTPFAIRNRAKPNNHWKEEWSHLVREAIPSGMLSDQVPADVKDVCPKFFSMTEWQKREFWAYFLQAMSVAESALNPATRFREVGIPGNDGVTGKPIWSEGLLQLSYQDAKYYSCNFDWSVDRNLSDTDKRKTIFDGRRNLECGVNILNRQIIVRKNPLFPPKHWYWAVLTKKTGNAGYTRLMAEMKNIPAFCRK